MLRRDVFACWCKLHVGQKGRTYFESNRRLACNLQGSESCVTTRRNQLKEKSKRFFRTPNIRQPIQRRFRRNRPVKSCAQEQVQNWSPLKFQRFGRRLRKLWIQSLWFTVFKLWKLLWISSTTSAALESLASVVNFWISLWVGCKPSNRLTPLCSWAQPLKSFY